jgi:hypothetical protein
MYTFMKVFYKTNLLMYFRISKLNDLKVSYSWFIFLMFDSNLVQNDFFTKPKGVHSIKGEIFSELLLIPSKNG